MGLLKARYQGREGTKIVDTHRSDLVVLQYYNDDPPREHDMDAACAMLNVGMDCETVSQMLLDPNEEEDEEDEELEVAADMEELERENEQSRADAEDEDEEEEVPWQ